jgi:hypothetical protein
MKTNRTQWRPAALAFAIAAMAAPLATASAQVSPLMGVWDAVTTVNGARVPLRYVITAGSTVTRAAVFPNGTMRFWGNYEIVGNQLHIIWYDWAPRQRQFPTGPLGDDCLFQFQGPNLFSCGDIQFWRAQ